MVRAGASVVCAKSRPFYRACQLPLLLFAPEKARLLKKKVDITGELTYVTSRGLERRRIVRDDTDRERWVDLLDRVATRRGWIVYAWALLDNHFHLRDVKATMRDRPPSTSAVSSR